LSAVERVRCEVALLGCEPESVVFTASGSEADNLAIKGAVRRQTELLQEVLERERPLQARLVERAFAPLDAIDVCGGRLALGLRRRRELVSVPRFER
jgi:hypothetical protein